MTTKDRDDEARAERSAVEAEEPTAETAETEEAADLAAEAEAPPPPPPPPKRFLRSRDDRVIAGVAGGLGRYFEIDPVIVRIAALVSIFLGGLGIVAYLLAVILVPADDGTGRPAPGSRGATAVRILGIGALILIGVAGFGALTVGALLATGAGYGLVVVAVIVVIGIALVAASFGTGARWLIVPALALTLGACVASAADLDLGGGIGDEVQRPITAAEIPDDGYELGIGRLAVDLRDIEWQREQVVHLDARLGIGEMVVAVPADVCVEADARAGVGLVRVAGQETDGSSAELRVASGTDAAPRLVLDADVDLGAVLVVNDDTVGIDRVGRGDWDGDDSAATLYREANAKACVT